jgi:hypothetical protein
VETENEKRFFLTIEKEEELMNFSSALLCFFKIGTTTLLPLYRKEQSISLDAIPNKKDVLKTIEYFGNLVIC